MPDDNKPLPASARKRGKLREQGMVVRSHDLVTTATLGVGLFGLLYFGVGIGGGFALVMQQCFTEMGRPAGHQIVTGAIMPLLHSPLITSLVLFVCLIALTAIVANLAQTGPLFLTDRFFQHGLDKFNPINGIKAYFTTRKAVAAGQALIKLIIIIGFAYAAVREAWEAPVFSRPVNVSELGFFFQQAAWSVGWRVLMALLFISIVDYLYQKWQYEKDNRMTFNDMKEEVRSSEGSPEAKGRIRGLFRRTRSLRRQIEDMSSATIVVTNPTHYAVALRYERNVTPRPLIVAKGIRLNAQAIKERAASLGIPTLENVPLARGLFKHGEVGEPIPALYYQAVAQILADLFRRGFRPAGN